MEQKDREWLAKIGYYLPEKYRRADLLNIWKNLARDYDNIDKGMDEIMGHLAALSVSKDEDTKEVYRVLEVVVDSVQTIAAIGGITAKMNRVMLGQLSSSPTQLKAIRKEYEESWKLLKKAKLAAEEKNRRGEAVYG